MVEIGPGKGALTRLLAGRVGSLAAVEIDGRLAAALRQDPALEGVRVIEADFLRVDLSELSSGLHPPPGTRLRVIGNLPYSVATAIVRKLLDAGDLVSDAVLTVQSEVAGRLLAGPGSRDYGYISVLVALHSRPRRLFDIGPGAFVPPPKVRSTVLALELPPDPPLPAPTRRALETILSAAFGQRRKTLPNALRALPARQGVPGPDGAACVGREAVAEALVRCGLPIQCRPEDVPPPGWVAIATYLRDRLLLLPP